MKIAFINQPFDHIVPSPHASSTSIWTYRVVGELADPGREFVIFARQAPDSTDEPWFDGVAHRWIPTRADDLLVRGMKLGERTLGFPRKKRPFFATSAYYRRYAAQVARDIRREKADIVHIHNFSQFVPIVRRANPDARIVLHMHCEWLTQLDARLIAARLAQTDLILGCSDHVTRQIQQRFPEHAARCHTLANGVDVAEFVPNGRSPSANGARRLLFVGRVSPEKGVHVLLDAFRIVRQRYPEAQLDIVGSVGSAPYEFMVLVSDDVHVAGLSAFYHGLAKKSNYFVDLQANETSGVHFTGPVPHADIAGYYHRADVLINPSFTEAFGMSLVEAMACERPVVATRVGGMPDVLDEGVTGLLVEPGDAGALAESIVRVLDDRALAAAMGQAGRRHVVERFAWNRVAAELEALYARLAQGVDA